MAAKMSEMVTPEEWKRVFKLYDRMLLLKASKKSNPNGKKALIELNRWYQEELPAMIQARSSKKHITYDELQKLTKWKVTIGKFRPTLGKLVSENKAEDVEKISAEAFKQVNNQLSAAIKTMSKLRGVGPATASAILAAGSPDTTPFMSDEAVLATGISNIKYDLSCYLEYAEVVDQWVKKLRKDDKEFGWNPHKVELALWTFYVAKQNEPDALDHGTAIESSTTKRKSTASEDKGLKKKKKQ